MTAYTVCVRRAEPGGITMRLVCGSADEAQHEALDQVRFLANRSFYNRELDDGKVEVFTDDVKVEVWIEQEMA